MALFQLQQYKSGVLTNQSDASLDSSSEKKVRILYPYILITKHEANSLILVVRYHSQESFKNGEASEVIDYSAKTHELQTIIEKQTAELSQWQRRVSDLNTKINEMEENMCKLQKEYTKSQEACVKLQRDLRENVAQKEDQEERIATLEKRYLNAQRESTSLHDLNEKLEQELRHKEAQLKVG